MHAIVETARRQAEELEAPATICGQVQQLRDSRDLLRSVMAGRDRAGDRRDRRRRGGGVGEHRRRADLRAPASDLVGTDVTRLIVPERDSVRPEESRDGGRAGRLRCRGWCGEAAVGGTHVEEWQHEAPDGSRRHLEFVVTPRPRSSGTDAGVPPPATCVVATDVTERARGGASAGRVHRAGQPRAADAAGVDPGLRRPAPAGRPTGSTTYQRELRRGGGAQRRPAPSPGRRPAARARSWSPATPMAREELDVVERRACGGDEPAPDGGGARASTRGHRGLGRAARLGPDGGRARRRQPAQQRGEVQPSRWTRHGHGDGGPDARRRPRGAHPGGRRGHRDRAGRAVAGSPSRSTGRGTRGTGASEAWVWACRW